MDELFTCTQIAKRYGVKESTVWGWVRSKKLPAIRIGKSYRISAESIRRFEEDGKTC